MKLAYFHLSHFPQARYRRRLTGVDGSTGVWKAVHRIEILLQMPSLARRFGIHMRVRITHSKFDIKISTVKKFSFSYVCKGFIPNTQRIATYEIEN